MREQSGYGGRKRGREGGDRGRVGRVVGKRGSCEGRGDMEGEGRDGGNGREGGRIEGEL